MRLLRLPWNFTPVSAFLVAALAFSASGSAQKTKPPVPGAQYKQIMDAELNQMASAANTVVGAVCNAPKTTDADCLKANRQFLAILRATYGQLLSLGAVDCVAPADRELFAGMQQIILAYEGIVTAYGRHNVPAIEQGGVAVQLALNRIKGGRAQLDGANCADSGATVRLGGQLPAGFKNIP